jgi:hypothetical protein
MDRLAIDLSALLRETVEAYADGNWLNARVYSVADPQQHIYATIAVPEYPRHQLAGLIVMARLVGDTIIVEHDTTDRPLWEALVQAGIPRSQIVLAYAGEPLPAAA